jgi:hypothetical protein
LTAGAAGWEGDDGVAQVAWRAAQHQWSVQILLQHVKRPEEALAYLMALPPPAAFAALCQHGESKRALRS